MNWRMEIATLLATLFAVSGVLGAALLVTVFQFVTPVTTRTLEVDGKVKRYELKEYSIVAYGWNLPTLYAVTHAKRWERMRAWHQ
jgi:hypothetical protein